MEIPQYSAIEARNADMTDERIMEMVAKGDLDKMRILFDRYHVYVYNFFLKKGHSASIGEDLTQNVFERILKYRTSYDTTKVFKAWFFRIARNIESDYIRKKKIQLDEGVELNRLEIMEENRLDEIEREEQFTILQQAISLLNQEDQEILHFSKFQKMKYSEIAHTLELSESAVKVKIHRAIKNCGFTLKN